MIGEDLVEKVIAAKIDKLVQRFEEVHGFAAFEETKAVMITELKRTGEELKEALTVKSLDQMALLDIIARGGVVFVKDVDPKTLGNGGNMDFRWFVQRTTDLRSHDELRFTKARVTIIVDPKE